MIIVKKRPMSNAVRKRLQQMRDVRRIFMNAQEVVQIGKHLSAGFQAGLLQPPDPILTDRIRTLVEEKINERQG